LIRLGVLLRAPLFVATKHMIRVGRNTQGPPPPPLTPPGPPPPGAEWACHSDRTVYCEDLGLAYLGTVKSYPTT
jgi:hypothetical protein